MRIYIVGPEQSGKSTASRFLSLALGISAWETGNSVTHHLAEMLVKKPDCVEDIAAVAATIDCDKEYYRKDLRHLGNMMTRLNPTALIDDCVEPYKPGIVVGVRRRDEVEGLVRRGLHHITDAVWIRIERPGKERDPNEIYDLQDMQCDYIIKNSSSLKVLREVMLDIAQEISGNKVRLAS